MKPLMFICMLAIIGLTLFNLSKLSEMENKLQIAKIRIESQGTQIRKMEYRQELISQSSSMVDLIKIGE